MLTRLVSVFVVPQYLYMSIYVCILNVSFALSLSISLYLFDFAPICFGSATHELEQYKSHTNKLKRLILELFVHFFSLSRSVFDFGKFQNFSAILFYLFAIHFVITMCTHKHDFSTFVRVLLFFAFFPIFIYQTIQRAHTHKTVYMANKYTIAFTHRLHL